MITGILCTMSLDTNSGLNAVSFLNQSVGRNLTNETASFANQENFDLKFLEFVPLIIIGTSILTANGILCWLFFSRPEIRQKPENALFCSQACGDLVNVVFIVMHILEETTSISGKLSFLVNYMAFLDLFGLFALIFDRYWSFTRPLQRRGLFDKRLLATEIALIWILPLAPSLMHFTKVLYPKDKMLNKLVYCGMMIIFSLFFTTLVILHITVYIKARHIKEANPNTRVHAKLLLMGRETSIADRNNEEQSWTLAREVKLVKVTFIMLMFYLMGHLPTIFLNTALSFGRNDLATNFCIQFSLYSFALNSVFNPLLCILVKRDFGSALYDSFRCKSQRSAEMSV